MNVLCSGVYIQQMLPCLEFIDDFEVEQMQLETLFFMSDMVKEQGFRKSKTKSKVLLKSGTCKKRQPPGLESPPAHFHASHKYRCDCTW